MKILIDMNLSPLWVEFFAPHEIEAIHWSAIGSVRSADKEILQYADQNGFVVFTHDLDFGALLATSGARGPSVIQVRGQDVLPAGIGKAVIQAILTTGAHLEAGALVTVDIARHRTRILPIGM